jgi:hypothetical protein
VRADTGCGTRIVSDSAVSVGSVPGALLQTLVAQQANAFADQGLRWPTHSAPAIEARPRSRLDHANGRHAQPWQGGAGPGADPLTEDRRQETTMYVGMGTVVVILLIVIFFMMMRRSRA